MCGNRAQNCFIIRLPSLFYATFVFFNGNLVFDFLESGLPSFPNSIPSGPVCLALRNREIAFLTNGRAGSGYECGHEYACTEN